MKDMSIVPNFQNSELNLKIEEWLRWDKNEQTREEIAKLVQNEDTKSLEQIFLKRLLFGTAGLRGKMGAGYGCMNDLVIIQTSQGLAKYLLSVSPEAATKGVVIGFDSRHNSFRFARLAASAYALCGIPVYLMSNICPTPFVPFCVSKKQAAAGIMVTASHNPKEDNGYKVYWDNGAQIIPPHDTAIQKSIEENLEPWKEVWDIDKLKSNPKITDPLSEISELYFKELASSMLHPSLNAETSIKFTVTAMHGVSHSFMEQAFKICNFKPFIPVKEQMVPDPDFPTVKFPNPEEGKSALDLSIKTANENDCGIILANDPDADRLAVAEKLRSGEWKVFTGNEEGSLLGWWAWHRSRQLIPHVPASDIYLIASTVSSKMLRTIASKEGFNFVETLTGFKWMGNKADELMKKGKTVLFAYEEAIGFMNGTEVLDKDGISAAMRLAEMAAYLETQGMTLHDKLLDLYRIYGYHASCNSYYLCYDGETIASMFQRIRKFSETNTYPTSVSKGKYKISNIRDLTTGYDSSQSDQKALLPSSSSSQMITFSFDNGCVTTLRTSGTEPKIKYYSEICASPDLDDWQALQNELEDLTHSLVEEFMEPQRNKLLPRPI